MNQIIKTFAEHGTFIQPETLSYIMSKKNPEQFTYFITKKLKEYPLILTLDQIKNIEQTEEKEEEDQNIKQNSLKIKNLETTQETTLLDLTTKQDGLVENFEKKERKNLKTIYTPQTPLSSTSFWKPEAREYDAEIKILKDVTGESTCEGDTSDFAKLFLNRYKVLKKTLQKQRRELANTIDIKRIKKSNIKELNLIGMVRDIRYTKNGHRLIELEDETGIATCIALNTNKEVFDLALDLVLDEVIGIKGQLSKQGDLIIVNNIVFPDISIQNGRNKAEIPVCVAFLSDIHIGSKKFLEREWKAFLKWINGKIGNSRQRKVAGRIKYIVLPGDLVDGIGIYPNQEKELSITDIYKQYEELAAQLDHIPDYMAIIMQPGNHDAVRPAEPQPAFEKEIQDLFSGKEIRFVGNPCTFSLHGVEILSYHGQSLLDFSTSIKHLKYNEPVKIMKHMLKKHHLAPTYGGHTPIAPEHSDYMIIDQAPDIFVTGHVHLSTIDEYRGVTLINASSWQAQTEYQKMKNFIPDPAKLPIVDLKSRNVTMMDFNRKNLTN